MILDCFDSALNQRNLIAEKERIDVKNKANCYMSCAFINNFFLATVTCLRKNPCVYAILFYSSAS